MPEMRSVFSSHINQIGYDSERQELHVTFANGSQVIYRDISERVARDVLTAPSIGTELHRSVRGQYSHHYLHRARGR